MGTVGRITYPSGGPIGKLADLLGVFATSIDGALPVKFVATLAALDAIGLTTATPAGTIATLSANDSGLAAGASFILTPDGKWKLMGSCTALNVDTFVTALSSNANVRVLPGAQAWNSVTSALVVFTTTAGAYISTTASKMIHGNGVTDAAVAIAGTFTVAVAFPSGSFSTEPKNVIVTTDSSRLTPAAVTRTKDGFSLQLSNWSNGAAASGVKYYWTAIA